jgi:hypothetical protein
MLDKILNYKNSNTFNFGPGKPYLNHQFNVFSSDIKSNYFDYLVFLDSKGFNLSDPKSSWIFSLIKKYEKTNKSYLVITRVKELTTFFSLINFLNLNNIQFEKLITNVGFVDLTPKKYNFIEDIISQSPFDDTIIKYKFLTNYFDEKKCPIKLYNIEIDKALAKMISNTLSKKFKQIYLIQTFEFNNSIKIERKRPDSFFFFLLETNKLLHRIADFNSNFKIINFELDEIKNYSEISFDAVHFTDYGHELVSKQLIKSLNL